MADDHYAGWERALLELRAGGWVVELTCAVAPVQLEGRLPDGREFYFRSRWTDVELSVGGTDPIDHPQSMVEVRHAGASHLSAEDGLPLLLRLAQMCSDGADRRYRPATDAPFAVRGRVELHPEQPDPD